MTKAKSLDAKSLAFYRKNPVRFFTDILDVAPDHVWDKMEEVANSVRDNPKTAVSAGHGVSKTYSAGRIALWFLYCFPPATVITTAPTHKQVEELLWREIRSAHAGAKVKLGGQPTATKLDLQKTTGTRWYALGFSTRPDTVTLEATAFQGYHNDHVLVIFDEAAGIMPQIWKATEHLMTAGHCRWLAIGNPTAPRGNFAEAINREGGWSATNISVLDTPNYKENREVISGVSGRAYEQNIRDKWGEDSNEYNIRILGKLPRYQEGTFFGREIAEIEKAGQIGWYPPDPMAKVYTFWDIGHRHTAIWFVQFVRQEIRLVDFYYDDEGLGMPAYAVTLRDKPYIYGQHWGPWDLRGSNAKSIQTGKYLIDVASELGVDFHVVEQSTFDDGISAARDLIKLCRFHKTSCETGLTALSLYRQQLDATRSTEDKPVYLKEPVRDWTTHPADAFRTLSMAYRYDLVVNDQRIGYPGAIPNATQLKYSEDEAPYDPLHKLVRRR